MRKYLRIIISFAIALVLFGTESKAYAKDNKPIHLYSRSVTLSSDLKEDSSTVQRTATARLSNLPDKKFKLDAYNDNGTIVYSMDVDDEKYRQLAEEYVNKLTEDPKNEIQLLGRLENGESEYHNDKQYDGKALSYAWKRNTAYNNGNNFVGGQTTSWKGNGNCDYIVLNQNIKVSGVGISITWPPAVSSNGNSASWQSQPIYKNVASATFKGFYVGGTAFSCSFTESGDVYKGGRVYRPVTYIKFSYTS